MIQGKKLKVIFFSAKKNGKALENLHVENHLTKTIFFLSQVIQEKKLEGERHFSLCKKN